jgi:hypothetical protein
MLGRWSLAKLLPVGCLLLVIGHASRCTALKIARSDFQVFFASLEVLTRLLAQAVLYLQPRFIDSLLLVTERRQLNDAISRGDIAAQLDIERSQIVITK